MNVDLDFIAGEVNTAFPSTHATPEYERNQIKVTLPDGSTLSLLPPYYQGCVRKGYMPVEDLNAVLDSVRRLLRNR